MEIENRRVFGLRIGRGETVVVRKRRGEDAGIGVEPGIFYTRTKPRREVAQLQATKTPRGERHAREQRLPRMVRRKRRNPMELLRKGIGEEGRR